MGALAVRVITNTSIQRGREQARQAAEARQTEPPLTGLAAYIERFWQAAQTAKRPVEIIMLRNLRQRLGVYDAYELAQIREQGGSEIYMMLTQGKCRGAESWLREILCNEIDRPWGLSPTPMPDLPPQVKQAVIAAVSQQAIAAGWDVNDARVDELLLAVKAAAAKRIKELAAQLAERHELVIADQFAEGGWEQALSDFIYNLVTYPAAFLKGPIKRMARARQWQQGPDGQWVPQVSEIIRPEWECRSPFDLFPAPAMTTLQRGNLVDRYRFQREDLQQMKGVEGYFDDAIDAVIEQYGQRGYSSRQLNDLERATLELRHYEQQDPEGNIEALNFWGSASGHMMLDWGYESGVDVEDGINERIDARREYQIEAWRIGRWTIKAQINPDPLRRKPYSKASFEEVAGAFWGQGLPEIIRDCQGMCNGAARALANNAAVASGPMVEISVDRLADGEIVTKPYPWKTHQTISDYTGNNQPAVRFWQANMNVQELLTIYTAFERIADNVSGFPAYSYGDAKVGGAGRTSSGLAQMMGNVGRGVRRVISAIDRNVVKPMVEAAYDFNMEWHPDATIKGDLRAVAKGSAAVLIKAEVALRQREMLAATLNPLDAQIIGPDGRAVMLRSALKAADFEVEDILPDALQLQLRTAGIDPATLLGKTGPNAPSTPGMGGGGGTPEAPENVDLAGQRPNGVQQREQNQGYQDGGVVRRGIDEGV